MKKLTSFLKIHISIGILILGSSAFGQSDYPSKPIRLVIPYAAGGLSDGVVRAVADELSKAHKMTFIVENRTGGNTIPAALAVTKAAADGYTLGWFAASTFTTVPALTPNLPFKTAEFQPIFMAYRGPIVMAVANNVQANNASDFVSLARKENSRALIGATAKGGAGHIMAAALGLDSKVNVELVAYRGGPPMLLELMSGQLPAAMDILDTFLTQHQAKKIRIIGHTGSKRISVIPEVPTFAESGFTNVKGQFWHGLFAPAGTPIEIVNLLNDRFNSAMRAPSVVQRLAPDLEVMSLKPQEFTSYIINDKNYWDSVIKSSNIKLD